MDKIFAQNNVENGNPFSGIMSGLNNIANSGLGSGSRGQDFKGIVNLAINSILNPLVALFIGIAVVYFLWGVLTYVRRGDSDTDREKGRQMMIYGIIALFVMVSVWGLVTILINTFNLSTSTPPVPKLQ